MTSAYHAIGPLRAREDLRSVAFLALVLLLFVIQWIGAARSPFLLVPTYVLAFVACIVKHNHIHCPMFRGARWNRGCSLLLSLLTGTPATGIITAHNERHHAHNNSSSDFVRCSLVRFRWNWINLLLFPVASVLAMYREKPSDLKLWRHRQPALYRQAILERAMTHGGAILLLVFDYRATIIYLIFPWLFAQWAIIAINLLQHQGCDPHSAREHSRNVTGAFINWLVLNNGFHAAHHLHPGLHWSRLPDYHRRHVAVAGRADLNQRSLALATWRQFFGRHA